TAPTATVSPSFAAMPERTPAAGAGTSMVTLSVSSSTTGSSTATACPGGLNQRPMVASVTDSPSVGTRVSTIGGVLHMTDVASRGVVRSDRSGQRLVEERLELRLVLRDDADSGRRRGRPAGVARSSVGGADLVEHPLDEGVDEEPRAHVARLFLAPDDLGLLEARQLLHQRLGGEWIELLDAQQVDVVDAALLALLVEVEVDLAGAQHHA